LARTWAAQCPGHGRVAFHWTTEDMKCDVPRHTQRSFADPYGEINNTDIQRKPREKSQYWRKLDSFS
jgi:hypothetical protein